MGTISDRNEGAGNAVNLVSLNNETILSLLQAYS